MMWCYILVNAFNLNHLSYFYLKIQFTVGPYELIHRSRSVQCLLFQLLQQLANLEVRTII